LGNPAGVRHALVGLIGTGVMAVGGSDDNESESKEGRSPSRASGATITIDATDDDTLSSVSETLSPFAPTASPRMALVPAASW
jgi:hypothetical protein